jgi:hypothetical protein
MAKRYLQITFGWTGTPKTKELEPVFNKAVDWMRLTNSSWIVWTSSTPRRWHERIKPFLRTTDSVFIVEINPSERFGQLPKWQWEWFQKTRSSAAGEPQQMPEAD